MQDAESNKSLFEATMKIEVILKSWAANNMNWVQVCKYAELAVPAPPPNIDFQYGWVNGEKEIVEK